YARKPEKVRNFLRSTVQEVAQLAAGNVYYGPQQCMHRFIHILVRKKLRSWGNRPGAFQEAKRASTDRSIVADRHPLTDD
ncbi:hypothetical protein, partial [Pseudomonas qingdaonensis]|uniref:hypothetical protein n=1 Tax=Pseudomonas qingdaonensis TaxID=2056231 RepID=UPI00197CDDEC